MKLRKPKNRTCLSNQAGPVLPVGSVCVFVSDFAAQGAVDEVHIEPRTHSVCQKIVLLGLVSGSVKRTEDRSVQSALFAQRLQNRVCHARRVKNTVDIAAVDIAGAGERAAAAPGLLPM